MSLQIDCVDIMFQPTCENYVKNCDKNSELNQKRIKTRQYQYTHINQEYANIGGAWEGKYIPAQPMEIYPRPQQEFEHQSIGN